MKRGYGEDVEAKGAKKQKRNGETEEAESRETEWGGAVVGAAAGEIGDAARHGWGVSPATRVLLGDARMRALIWKRVLVGEEGEGDEEEDEEERNSGGWSEWFGSVWRVVKGEDCDGGSMGIVGRELVCGLSGEEAGFAECMERLGCSGGQTVAEFVGSVVGECTKSGEEACVRVLALKEPMGVMKGLVERGSERGVKIGMEMLGGDDRGEVVWYVIGVVIGGGRGVGVSFAEELVRKYKGDVEMGSEAWAGEIGANCGGAGGARMLELMAGCEEDGEAGSMARRVLRVIASECGDGVRKFVFYAVRGMQRRALRVLAGALPSCNAVCRLTGDTVGHAAAKLGDVESVRVLMEELGAEEFEWSMGRTNRAGRTPLCEMVERVIMASASASGSASEGAEGRAFEVMEMIRGRCGSLRRELDGRVLGASARAQSMGVFRFLVEKCGCDAFDWPGVMEAVAECEGGFIDEVCEVMKGQAASGKRKGVSNMRDAMAASGARGIETVMERGIRADEGLGMAGRAGRAGGGPLRTVALVRLAGALDAGWGAEFLKQGHLETLFWGLGDEDCVVVLDVVEAVGYWRFEGSTAGGSMLESASECGCDLAVGWMLQKGARMGSMGGKVLEKAAEHCRGKTLEALHAAFLVEVDGEILEARSVLGAARGVHARVAGKAVEESDVVRASMGLLSRIEEMVGALEDAKRECGNGMFEIAANGCLGLERGEAGGCRDAREKLRYLVGVGAHEGKFGKEHVGEKYFEIVFFCNGIRESVEAETLLAYTRVWCRAKRGSSRLRGVNVVGESGLSEDGAVRLDVEAFTGGAGGLCSVDRDRLSAKDVILGQGEGAVRETKSLVWTLLGREGCGSVFLARGFSAGRVPDPDAAADGLRVAGYVLGIQFSEDATVGAPGVASAILKWMLGGDASWADLGSLSESALCTGMEGVDAMSAEDALGYIFGTNEPLPFGLGGWGGWTGAVTQGNVGEFGLQVAMFVRGRLARATGLMAEGFRVGLCGKNEGDAARAQAMVLWAVSGGGGSGNGDLVGLHFNGPVKMDVRVWRSRTQLCEYEGGEAAAVGGLFWSVVEDLTARERLRLYKFWTGSASPPAGGVGGMEFKIYKQAVSGRIPESHTCFNTMYVGLYATYGAMMSALQTCIANADVMLKR